MHENFQDLRSRLLKQRKELLSLEDTFDEGLRESMKDSTQELSMYDNDPADYGSELYEREKDLALRDNVHTQIVEIDNALKRIAKGIYGVCASCGKEIPKERLEAMPTAINCVDCKAKEEQHSNQLHPGSQDYLQKHLKDLLRDNDYSQRFGDPNDYPNLYDDWDHSANGVETYENLETEFDKETGMFVAKNAPQADKMKT